MRTSRVSRDTTKILSALTRRTPVTNGTSITSSPRSTRSSRRSEVVVKAEGESDSDLSSALSDVENLQFSHSQQATPNRKRKRPQNGSTHATTSTHFVPVIKTENDPEIAAIPLTKDGRPKKAKRQPAKKVKTEDGEVKIEAPPNWELMYDLTKEMRSKVLAPVDTMGCESLADTNADPKSQRFQTLVSLMLSSQTKDQVTAAATRNMQQNLPGGLTVASILSVSPQELNSLINKVGFHNLKTKYLQSTAAILRDKYESDIPPTIEEMVALPGVGPKMAYLCMSAAWGRDEGIGVDVHVHRITNLWGWHNRETKNPEETRKSLEAWLPKEKWHDINHLLVGLGQTICLPVGRKCGECTLADRGLCPGAVVGKIKKVKIEVKEEMKEEENTEINAVKREVTMEETLIKVEDVGNASSLLDIEDIGRASSNGTPRRATRSRE